MSLEVPRRTLREGLRYALSKIIRHFPVYKCVFLFQYVLPPNSVVYAGAVGEDNLADQLRAANKREGLAEVYQVVKGEKTGACGVVITGHNR